MKLARALAIDRMPQRLRRIFKRLLISHQYSMSSLQLFGLLYARNAWNAAFVQTLLQLSQQNGSQRHVNWFEFCKWRLIGQLLLTEKKYFRFLLQALVFAAPRQFLVLADEIFNILGAFGDAVAPSYMICETPMRENFYCGTVFNPRLLVSLSYHNPS